MRICLHICCSPAIVNTNRSTPSAIIRLHSIGHLWWLAGNYSLNFFRSQGKALETSAKIFDKAGGASKDELTNIAKGVIGVVGNTLGTLSGGGGGANSSSSTNSTQVSSSDIPLHTIRFDVFLDQSW